MPVARHRVAVGIELWLDARESFDGLGFRRFDFELKQRRRPVQIQNVWLSHVPKTESGGRDGADAAANCDQTDEEPNPSHAAPVKGEQNRAWRNNERHD